MIEIKMDEAGYEVYYSLDDAVKAFSHNIALENATLDLDIGLVLESDVDPFSNYGMEAIGEKVKEMASKAKSNFVLYAKKFINFFFGWLIKFFSGVVNIKKSMSSNYAKAQKYLKALNSYETQARQSSEKTVEITNAGNIVIYGLTMIQILKFSIVGATRGFNESVKIVNEAKATDINEIERLLGSIEGTHDLCVVMDQLPINDSGKLEGVLAKYQYNVGDMIQKLAGGSSFESGQQYRIKKQLEAQEQSKADSKKDQLSEDEAKIINSAVNARIDANKNNISNAAKFLDNPERRELKCPEAFDYLRTQLKMFIAISKANKWDFENDVKKCELARRKMMKIFDGVTVNGAEDSKVKEGLQAIIETGNYIAKLQNNANKIIKNFNKALDMMMADVTKLGSILTTIGGGPAKDKDADEE